MFFNVLLQKDNHKIYILKAAYYVIVLVYIT